MLQKRQNATFHPVGSESHVAAVMKDYPAGHIVALHFHDRDQLVYATRGVMTVRSDHGTWVVPTHRGVWIPAAIPHAITMSGRVAMRTLYLKPKMARDLPRVCCVVNVSPLLRELILQACTLGSLEKRSKRQRHLIDCILDQLETILTIPLRLPHPRDPRALRVAQFLMADPGNAGGLAKLCRVAGVSKRTVERLFQENTGMTFGRWRQQLRLMHAMRLLAEGAKVTYVALEAGYGTPSAFIAMFRKTLGTTPMAYFRSSSQNR